jgi:hypothetical protein
MDTTMLQDASFWDTISTGLSEFARSINWVFTFTLILLARVFTQDSMAKVIPGKGIRALALMVPHSWRVFAIGILYGGVWLYLRDEHHNKQAILYLINSVAFAMVFHKLLLEKILNLAGERLGIGKNKQ